MEPVDSSGPICGELEPRAGGWQGGFSTARLATESPCPCVKPADSSVEFVSPSPTNGLPRIREDIKLRP
jgi:hypothetical protein